MKCFSSQDSIDMLILSPRAYNALYRANIRTVGELMEFPKENLHKVMNLGTKSIMEIRCMLMNIKIDDIHAQNDSTKETENQKPKISISKDGRLYLDKPISELNLSARAYNCLNRASVHLFSDLLELSQAELSAIPQMGAKTVEELLAFRDLEMNCAFNKFEINEDETPQISLSRTLCWRIVQDTVNKIEIHAGNFYDSALPICEAYVSRIEERNIDAIILDKGFLSELNEIPLFRIALKKYIISIIESNEYGIDKDKLIEHFPIFLQNKRILGKIVVKLAKEGELIIEGNRLHRKYLSVVEFVRTLKNPVHYSILQMRFDGHTLEEIGKNYELTRERIRQITLKCMDKAPRLMEDKYAKLFQKYYFNKDDFIFAFNESEITFNYLLTAYKRGAQDIEELLDDENFPPEYRKAAEKIVYKKFVVLDDIRILCTRAELSDYILRTAGKEGITFEDFLHHYNKLLEDLNLQEDPKLKIVERGYTNKLALSDHALWKYGQKFRYYNINAYDFSELFLVLNLTQHKNIEYSTLKFFREFPELMNEYDIQDGYELHNLLKKICKKEDFPNIRFGRMPNIEFGTVSREEQVSDLLFSLAPISSADFGTAYEEEYGVLSQTVLANYLKGFEKYYHGGTYIVDTEIIPEYMSNRLSVLLKKDFYLLSEIRSIFLTEFPGAELSMLNSYAIKVLGFHVFSNYAVKDKYLSATDYFHSLLTKDEVFDFQLFPKDVQSVMINSAELYRMKANYEIIEYAPQKYIQISRLKSAGIKVEAITDYCNAVHNLPELRFFTVHYLRKKGFVHILDELGFTEWFYASLLSEDKMHFSSRRIGKNKLFSRGINETRMVDFIGWILYSDDATYFNIHDLVEYIEEEFNIRTEAYKIIEAIKESPLYFDVVSENLYENYDAYFEVV